MKMLWSKKRAAVVAAVLTLALTGCGDDGGSDGASSDTSSSDTTSSDSSSSDTTSPVAGSTMAFANVSSQITIIDALGDDVTEFMETQGVEVIRQDANFDAATQAQQLTTAINSGQIQAAWLFPAAPDALLPVIELAQSQGIPIVIEGGPTEFGFDGPQPGLVFDASSFTDYGETLGTEAAECVNDLGGDAQVALLEAPSVAGGAQDVHDAVTSTFADLAPDAEIVANAEAFDVQGAQTQMDQLLQAHPDISVVIAGSDETALGALGSFRAAGRTADCIVAGGGSPDVLQAQEDGDLTAVVAWDFTAAVDRAGPELIRLMTDPTAVGEIYETPITVIK